MRSILTVAELRMILQTRSQATVEALTSTAWPNPTPSLLRDPLTFRDPYPAYAALRPHSPLQVSRSSWILLSYEHVRAALADPERFSSNVRGVGQPGVSRLAA